ncbi:MAG: PIN domain-containing protein, partial [Candidatus Omnitrophota bacterium]
MTFGFIRILFVLLSMVVGFQLGSAVGGFGTFCGIIGMGVGTAVAGLIILLECNLGKVSMRGLSAAVFGMVLALIVANFLKSAIDLIPDLTPMMASSIKLIGVIVMCYLGMVFAMRGRDEFNLIIPYIKFDRQDVRDQIMILDTSVIIDGRILDLCQTKFIDGRFVVPRFVLKELQQVADSQDAQKRVRGRRGLEILNKLKKIQKIAIKIHEEDFPDIAAVDEKLVKLARLLSAKVLTNDYNLN